MRYWLDTEFIDDGTTIELISLGIVAEDERVLYIQNGDSDFTNASEWVQENVLPHLAKCFCPERWGSHDEMHREGCEWQSRRQIAALLREFCDPATYGKPEFWGWCSAYDWVAICQLYGTMMDKPEGWPSYIRDLQQELDLHGISDATLYEAIPNVGQAHHALADAQYVRSAYQAVSHVGRITMEQP